MENDRKIFLFTGLFILLMFCLYGAGKKSSLPYELQRIAGPITLDGLSDEKAWLNIKPLPLIMQVPDFGKRPSERTEILLAYDDEYLYLAGRLYDRNPEQIQASSKKRDTLGPGNDWFGIVIDSFNDKENALCFFTTPTGLRTDMTVFNDAQGEFPLNTSWNTFWDVATVKTKDGWFAEMRIPFTSLRFQNRNGRVLMGISLWRFIARKNEVIIFPRVPRDRGQWSIFQPSLTRECLLSNIKTRKALYVTPYMLGGFSLVNELNDEETAYEKMEDFVFEPGLDIKYGITSNLTLDITINTDFAQVEADDEQVNLTRFSLFFPEKRLFFQERASIFDFSLGGPNRLFYSRQIGLYEEELVRIYGGLRLVGRVGPWDLGLLSMQTAPIEDLASENFSVIRLRRQIFNPYSYIGCMITSRVGMDGTYNIAYGIDGIFRLFGDDYLTLNWAQTFEDDRNNNVFSLAPSRFRINWEKRNIKGFHYNIDLSRCGVNYNPEMGFQSREDYTRTGSRLGYGWLPGEKSKLFSHTVFLDGFVFWGNQDHTVESIEIGCGYEQLTKAGSYGRIMLKGFYEDVPEDFAFSEDDEDGDEPDILVGQYRFMGLEGIYVTPMNKPLSLESHCYLGSFYDGWRISFGLTPRWNISSSLELSATYLFDRIKFPDRDRRFYSNIARLRMLVMLSTKLSASAFIQYNSVIDAVITNIRVRYNPREGNDLYLVYNEGTNTNRLGYDPVRPVTGNRTIMLKYTYTFQL